MVEIVEVGTVTEDASDDATLYRALAPELIRFATALVGPSDAPDVLSIAVVKALSSRTWATVTNRRAYLYRAVMNTAVTHRRRAAMRLSREGALILDQFAAPEVHPEVRAAVSALSLRQRAVVVLTYWADLPPAAVAELLGISDGAVRRHLARARANLRKVLDD